jgi:aconitase B
MAQMAQQTQMEFQQSQTAALAAQAAESQARASKYEMETQLLPEELQIEKIEAITRNLKEGDQEDKEFERRLKVADTLLKERELTEKNKPKELPKENPNAEIEQRLLNQLVG